MTRVGTVTAWRSGVLQLVGACPSGLGAMGGVNALTVGSVCSGVGLMDLGLHRAGLRHAWFCEADPYRRRVLARHWPGVPCYPDLGSLTAVDIEPVDLLAGGTPCQDLSVAGNRAGLASERSGLFFDFVRLRDELQPRWTAWENVEGALSSHGGRDFALIVSALVGARAATHTTVERSRAEADALTATRTPLCFHATQDPISGAISPALGANSIVAVMIDE